ncbi:SlyX family protein [Celeribacter indicus]|uniref:SlyX protein n=1 Tax=Celeribacter indicus TaxID=1208324 RepID=A0A0B5DYJ1_9RHOB|nr:SlyX family protein [Celeribacter indicus]AJE48518.1 SlyX protein [Celeribacter indicus]SDX07600.1 SlyX protein [Celeribacter indicus]
MENETRIVTLEEQVAYLTKVVDELSDVVARQERVIEAAERRLGLLMEAEAARQSETEGTVPLVDQRPPHW